MIDRGSFEEEEEGSFLYALSDNPLILTLGGHFVQTLEPALGHPSPPSWAGTLCAQSVSISIQYPRGPEAQRPIQYPRSWQQQPFLRVKYSYTAVYVHTCSYSG